MDIIRTAHYIRGLELMKLIFAVLDVSLTMGLTRCYKTEGFFYIYLIDMAVNFMFVFTCRSGLWRCANIASCGGQIIQWETDLKYLGVHIVNSRGFKCSLTSAKCSFYRSANAVFGKIGGRSSEDVILQLIHSKCMPALRGPKLNHRLVL